ncbi:MAG: tetratricopeptide repeat protein [Chloroflexota bacterium]|nr:tetratricopeptide repeat protein [Chloroflexota bacterium]
MSVRAVWLEAQALIEEHGTLRDTARSLANLGMIDDLLNDKASANKYYRRALMIQRSLKDRQGMTRTLLNMAFMALDTGDFTAAKTTADEAMHLIQQSGERLVEGDALGILGEIAAKSGDLDEALRRYNDVVAHWRAFGQPQRVVPALGRLADARLRIGDSAGARAALVEALTLNQTLDPPVPVNTILQTAARMAFAAGDVARAYALMRAVGRMANAAWIDQAYDADFFAALETLIAPDARAALDADLNDTGVWATTLLNEWKGISWQDDTTKTSTLGR